MVRLHPRRIRDKFFLSRLLEQYLHALQHSPLEVKLRALSYDSAIPEAILLRLQNLHRAPDDAANIDCRDYHIVFANLMFRFPTVKFWLQPDGQVFIEM